MTISNTTGSADTGTAADSLGALATMQFKQYINGQWLDAANGHTWEVHDPATQAVIATVPFGNATDVRQALEAANAAFPAWSAKTPYDRAAILMKATGRGIWLSYRRK